MAEKSIKDIILSYTNITDVGCWEWSPALIDKKTGYAQYKGIKLLHRFVFQLCYPAKNLTGLELHHTCDNKACINPDHLQPITREEHGRITLNQNAKKTHCKRGHPFTPENTYVYEYQGKKRRSCRTCGGRKVFAKTGKKCVDT